MCKDKSQNRIDYIVLQKPEECAKILEKYGYQAPKKKEDLPRAVRHLVKKKGEPVIKDLIQIHPEKELILAVTGHNSDESNFCGCQSSYYTEETKQLLDQLSEMSIPELTKFYDDRKLKAKEKPGDKVLLSDVETVWDELKRRKKQTDKLEKKEQESSQSQWLKFGFAFLAGIVVAKLS